MNIKLDCDKYYLNSNTDDIKSFVLNTDFAKYDYVLGIGDYSGKDQDYIRIETRCSSQFRNNKTNLTYIKIPYYFKADDGVKLASGIGNSWCNLVSYLILCKSPYLKYTFLHVPRLCDYNIATNIIYEQLYVNILI